MASVISENVDENYLLSKGLFTHAVFRYTIVSDLNLWQGYILQMSDTFSSGSLLSACHL